VQRIFLTGVVDDGTRQHPRVPRDTAKTIQIPLMTDVVVEVEVVNNAGVAVDLRGASAWSAYFTVVRQPNSCAQAAGQHDFQLRSTTLAEQTRNVVVFALTRFSLQRLPAGRYFYDVSLDLDGIRYQVVRISGLHLSAALRRA
jgi:hypothetical protein